ncbi:MAG: catalase [Oscillospiraceae bacterium]|nr:catalase [Oscillospiraceae bacterium]MBQ4538950.1 catalase [Oscillospiraceae bacterium]
MTRLTQNEFDQSTLEAMMDRYRAELLRYQRATPPGRPTLEQNLQTAISDNTEITPEPDDIWDQPAIPVAEQPGDLENQPLSELLEEPEPPQIESMTEAAPFYRAEYAKCIGAYGSFSPYRSAGDCCKADFLQRLTEVIVRFAADIPHGAAESSRCRRSFWVRFCGEGGNFDLPAYFMQDDAAEDMALSSAISASMCADPATGLRDKERFWRAICSNPAALLMAARLYTDGGTIASYRMADGFSPPMIWTDPDGRQRLVRTSWLSSHRPKTLSRFEAEELAASDPDALSRDLVTAIANGEKPQYELVAQFIDYPLPADLGFDPLDPAVEWSKQLCPPQKLGRLTLERLPKHFAEEIAALQFDAADLPDGISPAPLKRGEGVRSTAVFLSSLGEFDRKTLASNLVEDLCRLSPELLERTLLLFTDADLSFGRMLTAQLGGL